MFRLSIPQFNILMPIMTKDEAKAIMITRSFLRDHNFMSGNLEKYSNISSSYRMVCRVSFVPPPQPDRAEVQEQEQLSIGW